MVLDLPQSDPDPYLSSSSTDPFSSPTPSESSTVPLPNFSALPQPFSLGRPLGYPTSKLRTTLTNDLTALSKRLQRPLTSSEAEAWAYHDAKCFRYASYGPPLGAAVALYRYRNRIIRNASDMQAAPEGAEAAKSTAEKVSAEEAAEAFKKEWAKKSWVERNREAFKLGFNAYGTRSMGSEGKSYPFAEMAEQAAQRMKQRNEAFKKGFAWAAREHLNKPGPGGVAWNATVFLGRAGFYAIFGSALGELLMGTYGMTVAIVGKFQDPRLKTVRDESEKIVRQQGAKNAEKGSANMRVFEEKVGGNKKDPMGQGQKTAAELWREHRSAIGGGTGMDDASPTAGNMDSETFFEQQQTEDTSMTSEPQPRPIRRSRPIPSNTETPSPESTDFTADYTSSTPSDDTTSSNASPAGESTWERIRRENATSGRRRPRPRGGAQQEDQGNSEDSFNFSRAQEENSYAKEEAQKRFDERVERERKGEDFTSGGGRRRW